MQNITEKMDEKTFSLVKNNPELWNLFPWPLNWIIFYSLHLINEAILVVKMRFEHPTACDILALKTYARTTFMF